MDIDIDIAPSVSPEGLFRQIVPASRVEGGILKKHPVGYYMQDIPLDAVTKLAAIPYTETEDDGFYKIDFLTVNLLKHFDSKKEMVDLQYTEPDWDMLLDADIVGTLFHIGKHAELLAQVRPRSILELADVFALIRPNKRPLLYKYLEDPNKMREELYTKRMPEDMRKAHAIPYAILIVLQLHLIGQGRI